LFRICIFSSFKNGVKFCFKEIDKTIPLVNFDTRKIILGVIDQAIKKEEAITLFQNATHFLDKVSAIRLLKSIEDSVSLDLIELAMKDEFWSVRKSAIKATK
jgi:hypothetical protein